MNYFLSWKGLELLASRARGTETLGVGIRPYGLHAGNLASVVTYPYLFCEFFEKSTRVRPRFRFQVWVNDIEPVTYVGANGRRISADPANMYPGSTTFQFMPAPNGFNGSLTDYWQPAIEGVVRGTIGARFPDVILEFRRASELVGTPEFEKAVIGCINRSDDVKSVINRWNRGVAHVLGPASFVWPLCDECHEPLIKPKLQQVGSTDFIAASHESTRHIDTSLKLVKELSWAVQFRMMHAARLAAIQPDVWFMGMDHVPTNMGELMEDLADIFGISRYGGRFLHAPLLFAKGDKKLSKTHGAATYISLVELVDALRGNKNSGLDVTHAPVSSDIMSIGPNLLPMHMVSADQRKRLAAIETEMKDYEKSGKRTDFRSANVKGKIRHRRVARIVGVPHL